MHIYAVFFQRKTGAGVCQIQDVQFRFLAFDQMFVHEECFRIFVNDYVQAVCGQIFQVVVHKKPGVDICFRNYFFVQAGLLDLFEHPVIGALEGADQGRGKVFVKFPGDIRSVLQVFIFVWRHEDA